MEIKNCVYVPFFNEYGAHLERLLESLSNWNIKKAYFGDGPFPTFPHTCAQSTDGSREMIKGYDFTQIIDCGIGYMPIKTNFILHRAAKDGFSNVLIMGCDEYLEGDLNRVPQQDTPMARVHLIEHNPTGKYNRWEDTNPRMICWPGVVRSVDVHWFFFVLNELIDYDNQPIIEGITIHCDDNLRPKARDDQMTVYQDKHSIEEKKIIQDKFLKQILDFDFPPVISRFGTKYWSCGCITYNDGTRLVRCTKHVVRTPKL